MNMYGNSLQHFQGAHVRCVVATNCTVSKIFVTTRLVLVSDDGTTLEREPSSQDGGQGEETGVM